MLACSFLPDSKRTVYQRKVRSTMRHFCLILFLVVQAVSLLPVTDGIAQSGSGEYSLTVLNLRVSRNTLSYSDARKISNQLNDELGRESMFYTMSHSEMERGLLSRRRDPAIGCATLSCAVENGKLLGSQLVVYGTVLQTGRGITIETHLVHVGSHEVVKSFSDNISADLGVLNPEIATYVRRFLGLPDIVAARPRAVPRVRREAPPQRPVRTAPVTSPESRPSTREPQKPYIAPEPFAPAERLLEDAAQQAALADDARLAEIQKKLLQDEGEAAQVTETDPEQRATDDAEPFELWPAELSNHEQVEVAEPPEDDTLVVQDASTGFKWGYLGLGVLVAGGVGAGLLLAQDSDSGGDVGGGPPPPVLGDLPGPPKFP